MVAFSADQDDQILEVLGKDKFFCQAWLKYAQSVCDTEDVFDFMVSKGIGSDSATCYIEIASYLEHSLKDLSKAEALLRKGLDYLGKHKDLKIKF